MTDYCSAAPCESQLSTCWFTSRPANTCHSPHCLNSAMIGAITYARICGSDRNVQLNNVYLKRSARVHVLCKSGWNHSFLYMFLKWKLLWALSKIIVGIKLDWRITFSSVTLVRVKSLESLLSGSSTVTFDETVYEYVKKRSQE